MEKPSLSSLYYLIVPNRDVLCQAFDSLDAKIDKKFPKFYTEEYAWKEVGHHGAVQTHFLSLCPCPAHGLRALSSPRRLRAHDGGQIPRLPAALAGLRPRDDGARRVEEMSAGASRCALPRSPISRSPRSARHSRPTARRCCSAARAGRTSDRRALHCRLSAPRAAPAA